MKIVGIPILMATIAEIVLMAQEKIGELEAMNNSILCWLIPIFIVALLGGMYFLIMWTTEKEYRDMVAWEKKLSTEDE